MTVFIISKLLNKRVNYSIFSRKHEYESFLCTLLLSGADIRSFIFAVRAFNVEIALIRDQISQKEIGVGRISFWRDAINKTFKKKPEDLSDVPRHPTILELNRVNQNLYL